MYNSMDLASKYLACWSDDDMELEPIFCSVNEGHGRTGARLTNLTVTIEERKTFNYDMIWTWYSEPMISDKVINIISSEGLVGYTLKPVVIKKVKKPLPEIIPVYKELFITGNGGEVHKDSKLIIVEKCDSCGHIGYRGWENKLIINERNWDGSDFFHLKYPGGIFVTEKVKKIFEKYQVSNVEFIPMDEVKNTWDIKKYLDKKIIL